jgi:hypothetical protein
LNNLLLDILPCQIFVPFLDLLGLHRKENFPEQEEGLKEWNPEESTSRRGFSSGKEQIMQL